MSVGWPAGAGPRAERALSGAVVPTPCACVCSVFIRVNLQGHGYCSALLRSPHVPAGTKPWLRPAFSGTETHGEMEHNGLPRCQRQKLTTWWKGPRGRSSILPLSGRDLRGLRASEPCAGRPVRGSDSAPGPQGRSEAQRPGSPLAAPRCGHLFARGSLTSETGEESRWRPRLRVM